MQLHIGKNATDVIEQMAIYLQQQIQIAIAEYGICSIVLAGGNTPKALYKQLAQPTIANSIDWKKVYFFWGDERYVPNTHNDSNEKMATENLLQQIPVPTENIFAIPTTSTPENDAFLYNQTVENFLAQYQHFSLVLLGLGSDGHTLSLFPNTSILTENNIMVSHVWVPQLNTNRISLTYPCAAKANQLLFLVTGTDKANVLQAIINNSSEASNYPTTKLVQENNQKVHWFIEDVVKLGV
jgi:6-phosphogluconolactonase